jgi:hypothetical protein
MTKKVVKMRTTLNILPFGQAHITIKSGKEISKKKEQRASYSEPQTTEEGVVEINFAGDNYSVPKTTAGIL